MSVVVKVTPKKKTGRGRKPHLPSVKDFCRLCGCCFKIQYGESARSIATENLFQASNQKGIVGVVLAKLCEDVGLKVAVSTTSSDRVCSTCARKIRNMHQLYSFVATALGKNEGDEIYSRFKRLPTSVSSPERSPAPRKVKKNTEQTSAPKREGDQDRPSEGSKRQKSMTKKSIFSRNSEEDQDSANVSSALENSDWGLGLLNVDDIVETVEQSKTRVKVLILYPGGHIEVRTPNENKTISVIKNIALKEWRAAANGVFNHTEMAEELPAALKRKVSTEFKEYCRSDSVLKGTDPDQLSSFSNRLVLRETAIFCPLWNAAVTGAAGDKDTTDHIALSTAVVARCRNATMSAIAYRISMILFHSAARNVDYQRLNRLGICMSADMTVALQKKMSANYDSKVLVWKKEIEKNKGAIRLLEEIKRDQIPTDNPGENVIDVQRPRMTHY